MSEEQAVLLIEKITSIEQNIITINTFFQYAFVGMVSILVCFILYKAIDKFLNL